MQGTATSVRRAALGCMLGAAVCMAAPAANAFTVALLPGNRMLYLQVGLGTISFTSFFGLAVPNASNNSAVNLVTATVPAAAMLSRAPVPMTANSNVTTSPARGTAVCPAATDVFVGGLYRKQFLSGAGTATLQVSTSAPLTAGARTMPFTEIAWDSVGIGDTAPTIQSGQFTGSAAQVIGSVDSNDWFEGCLRFRFLNTRVYPAGTFNGTAIYTLSAP